MLFGFKKKKKQSFAETLPAPERLRESLRHIAFIMDGNGRWAKKRLLPREQGHVAGAKNFVNVIEHCGDIGIETVTVYAFSTENWNRPEREVSALMNLFGEYMERALLKSKERGLRVVFLGDKARYPEKLRQVAEALEADTKDGKLTLNVAINYGSRDEIVNAVNSLIAAGKTSVTKEDISRSLYTAASPDPDLIVRTGGEYRISNFLLWQSAYAEYFFTETLWPDLSADEIDAIVLAFLNRDRRFGGVKDTKQ